MSSNIAAPNEADDDAVTNAPIPPPPVPPFPPRSSTAATASSQYITDHTWAFKHPDIRKACYLARVCPIVEPKACRLKDIPSILQEGPTCGLAALSMLGLGEPSAAELLRAAKEQQFTRNGEMFSAANLLQLATERNVGDAEMRLFDGPLGGDEIRGALRDGGCLLVPYDADFNHGPCLRRGHKAHWALIIGYLIDDDDQFFVLARHGKTRNVAVWLLNELAASNANLVEFEQPKAHPDAEFQLPAGGVGGALGLRDKCIVVARVASSIVDIVIR